MSQTEPERNWTEIGRKVRSTLAVLVSLAVLVGGGAFAYSKVNGAVTGLFLAEDYPGPGEQDVSVEIPQGTTVDGIGEILADKDVIASTDAFDQAKSQFPEIQSLQAGTYQLKTKMKAADAVQKMLDAGVKNGRTFTIREGLRLGEQVKSLSEQTGIPEDKYNEALKHPDQYGLSPWSNENPPETQAEGYLFPDTYSMSGDDPNSVLKLMTSNFNTKAREVKLDQRAQQMGRDPNQLVIVASMIEAEVHRPEDRPKVARVLYNRLDDNMPLQLDTTVDYANKRERGTGAETTAEQRANQSPYNTYIHPGLPPGPIGAPGKAALEAAANPAEGNWKFFVAVNLDTGETLYADTLPEHEKNVAKWRQWCSDNPGKC